jgi:hypothetical protein
MTLRLILLPVISCCLQPAAAASLPCLCHQHTHGTGATPNLVVWVGRGRSINAQSLHHHCAVNAPSLQHQRTITAASTHNHCSVISPSLHPGSTIIPAPTPHSVSDFTVLRSVHHLAQRVAQCDNDMPAVRHSADDSKDGSLYPASPRLIRTNQDVGS